MPQHCRLDAFGGTTWGLPACDRGIERAARSRLRAENKGRPKGRPQGLRISARGYGNLTLRRARTVSVLRLTSTGPTYIYRLVSNSACRYSSPTTMFGPK